MKILFTGSIDGEILDFYSKVLEIEKTNKFYIDWVISVGDFGIWPDAQKIDKATRLKNKVAGDFPYLYLFQWEAPKQTLAISGVHEDHDWLANRVLTKYCELIPNVSYLVNGNSTTIGDLSTELTVTGVGKSYSIKGWSYPVDNARYYTSKDIRNAKTFKSDIFISYEAPQGVNIGGKFTSIAKGIGETLKIIRPKLYVHSTHLNLIKEYEYDGIPSFALGRRQVAVFDVNYPTFSRIL